MAAKIKDGLFIGDAETSQDPEFLELNKINHLINFAGREIPNVWAAHGLVYNTYNWEDRDDFKLFDLKHEILSEIVIFIDKAIRHGGSVLLFSTRGVGRCTAAVCAYLMYKYGWGFEKSYDFVYSKKPDIELNRSCSCQPTSNSDRGFVEQLFTLDKKLRSKRYQGREGGDLSPWEVKRITEWDPIYLQQTASEEQVALDGSGVLLTKGTPLKKTANPSPHVIPDTTSLDELLMVHSYINSKMTITSLPGPYEDAMRQPKQFKLQINLANNQEAGVHLRRTAPPSLSAPPPRGGILKGGPNNHRMLQQTVTAPSRNSRTSTQHQGHKHTMKDLEEDNSSLSDEEITQSNRTKYPAQNSIDTLSLPNPSQSSQASDLYDFVGLTQQPNQERKHNSQTAEERLHNLLDGLQRGGEREKGKKETRIPTNTPAEPKRSVRTSFERESKGSAKQNGAGITPSTSSSSLPSSIHDIATMNIQPSYQPPPPNSSTATRTRAYPTQQQSTSNQPIKTNTHISIRQGERGEKQAWGDERDEREREREDREDEMMAAGGYYNQNGKVKTRGSVGNVPTSRSNSSSSTAPPSTRKTSTPSSAYRHGSPAPQVSRTGLSSKTNRDDSLDERDNRSTTTTSTTGTRGSTPVRSNPTPTSGTGRSNTPLRQRVPSPSGRDRPVSGASIGNTTPRDRLNGTTPREKEILQSNTNPIRSSTPSRDRPESRERGNTNPTPAVRGTTPTRGVRTDGSSGTGSRSSSPWTETSRGGWKY